MKFLNLIVCFFLISNINAQDLIVTKANDSINAKITDVKPDKLNFNHMKNDLFTSDTILLSDVKYYQKLFYVKTKTPDVDQNITKIEKSTTPVTVDNTTNIEKSTTPVVVENNTNIKKSTTPVTADNTTNIEKSTTPVVVENTTNIEKSTTPVAVENNSKIEKFRFSLNSGLGIRLAKAVSDTQAGKDHINGVRYGLDINVDANYNVNKLIWLGVKYNRFNSSNTAHNLDAINDSGTVFSGVKTDFVLNYIGINVFTKNSFSENKKHWVFSSASIGYLDYSEVNTMGINSYNRLLVEVSGETLGRSFDVGYEYRASKNIAFAFSASLTGGNCRMVDVTSNGVKKTVDAEKSYGAVIGLGRFSMLVGLSYYL